MTFSAAASGAARLAPTQDFSLVLGGPLFQLLRRLRLSDDAGGLLRRRVVFYVMITWTPLLVFSAAQGQHCPSCAFWTTMTFWSNAAS